jgi:hypothetical protein
MRLAEKLDWKGLKKSASDLIQYRKFELAMRLLKYKSFGCVTGLNIYWNSVVLG